MEQETQTRKQLVRDVKREALTRMEDAARSVKDFENVIKQWNHLDENRERRERDNEIGRPDEEMLHWTEGEDGEIRTVLETVIPRPIEHEWWRQLIRGDFLDVIFDCPHELHELVSNDIIYRLLFELNENQKEVLYYRVIRQYSPQKIAKMRKQSDRNIRKVYDTAITRIRKKLYIHLVERHSNHQSLTYAQRQFVTEYAENMNEGKEKSDQITVTSFLLRSMAVAVKEQDRFRMQMGEDGQSFILKKSVNIGIAVGTPEGLTVPVLRDADTKAINEINAETAYLAQKARDGKLLPEEYRGGVITLTNMGMFGVTAFTPIINQPEASILGTGVPTERLVLEEGQIVAKKFMFLSLTYDHRIINGTESALFEQRVKELLESPEQLI